MTGRSRMYVLVLRQASLSNHENRRHSKGLPIEALLLLLISSSACFSLSRVLGPASCLVAMSCGASYPAQLCTVVVQRELAM